MLMWWLPAKESSMRCSGPFILLEENDFKGLKCVDMTFLRMSL